MNLEEAKEALKTARWKTEGLYNLHAAGMKPGETNGHMVLCVSIVEEIDKALNILAHVARRGKDREV